MVQRTSIAMPRGPKLATWRSYISTSVKPSSRGEYEIPDAITAMLAAELRVYAFPLQGFWTDVGTPEDLARAEALLTRTGR